MVTLNQTVAQELVIQNARILDGAGAIIERGSIRDGRINGVTVAFGTDSFYGPGVFRIDDVRRELKVLSSVFSPHEVIMALTRNAAIYLDRAGEIGTLESGKLADIQYHMSLRLSNSDV